MVDLFRFSANFQPVLLEGLTASIFGTQVDPGGLNVVCRAVMSLPELQHDFGALTAAVWSGDLQDADLQCGTMELAQYRIRVMDDVQVRLKNPGSVQQWRTLSGQWYLPKFPQGEGQDWLKEFYWMASEFFVFQDRDDPRFNLFPMVPATAVTSRVLWSGWKFKLEKIAQKGKIEIWVNSWPATTNRS